MTRPVSWWLVTGLVVAIVAAANQPRPAEARLDPATLTELSRRLDLVVSGGPALAPPLSISHAELEAKSAYSISDRR